MLEKKFSVMSAVGPTKLGMVMFTKELAMKFEGTGVTINSLHPGLARTTLLKDMSPVMKLIFKIIPHVTPEAGAATSIYLASSPEPENINGKFFSHKKETATSSGANDPEKNRKLYELSLKLAGLA